MKNLMKAMDKTKAAFKYVQNKFRMINEVKINEGVFVRLQIRKRFLDGNFDRVLRRKE